MLRRLSRALGLCALLPTLGRAWIYKPVLNVQTGRPDLITPLSTSTIQAGTNVSVSTNSDGSVTISATGGGGGGGGAGVIAGTGSLYQTPYVSVASSNTLQMSNDILQYPSTVTITVPLTVSTITAVSSITVNNITINGTCTGSGCGSGSGGGIVSPGTFTWTNNFGVNVSSVNVNSYGSGMSISTSAYYSFMNKAGFIYPYQHYAFMTADYNVTSIPGGSLDVFDVANPTAPVMLVQFTTTTYPYLAGAEGIEISGKYLFVASSSSNALVAFDISSPANPVQVGVLQDNVNLQGAESVRIVGNYAYITNFTFHTITSVNISNPYAMSISSTIASGTGGSNALDIKIRYPYAFVTNNGSCVLGVIDISNPAAMLLKASFTPTGCTTGQLSGEDYYGRYLYVGDEGQGAIYTIDISSPLVPVSVSSITTGGALVLTLKVNGSNLYFSYVGGNAIYQYSLANPKFPAFANSLVDATNLTGPDDISFNGSYLYASLQGSGNKGGIGIVNIGALNAPSMTVGTELSDYVEVTHDLTANRIVSETSIVGQNIFSPQIAGSTGTFTSILTVSGQNVCEANGTNCPASSGSGIVSPATFTWQNNYGMSFSTITVSSNTILSGATFYQGGPSLIQQITATSASGVGIGKTPALGSGCMDVSGIINSDTEIQSSVMAAGYLTGLASSKPLVIIPASGANNGMIEDRGSKTWDLGYGNSPTSLGTAVLSWDSTPAVIVSSSMTVQGANGLNVTYGVNAGSMTGAGLSSCSGASNAVSWNSSTNLFGCNTITGGGGAAALAVGMGGPSGYSVKVTSPTSDIIADSNTIIVSNVVGSTAVWTLNPSSVTLQGNNLSTTYLTNSSATATYLMLSSATATYLTQSSASLTYLYDSSATATYLMLSSATATYLSKTVAAATYLTGNQTITLSGDSTGSGATAIAVTAAATQANIAILSHAVTHTSSVTVTAAGGVGVTYGVIAGSVSVNALLISTTAITGNFTLTSTTTVVMANCASACTMTLPTAVGISGEIFNIKMIGAGAVSINTTSAQTIDGSTTITPSPNQWANIEVISDGSNWSIL